MTNRGLLVRHRRGRRVFFGLTPRCEEILEDGRVRIWDTGAVNHDTDGPWTLLSFSMPEAWQRQRHDLRSRLAWSGFGPLQSGLWIAPGRVDVASVVAELGLDAHVRTFHAVPAPPTDLAQVVSEVFDLDALAAGYDEFLAVWDRPDAARNAGDALALTLRLSAEWLEVIRRDPRLPLHLLPERVAGGTGAGRVPGLARGARRRRAADRRRRPRHHRGLTRRERNAYLGHLLDGRQKNA